MYIHKKQQNLAIKICIGKWLLETDGLCSQVHLYFKSVNGTNKISFYTQVVVSTDSNICIYNLNPWQIYVSYIFMPFILKVSVLKSITITLI